MVDVVFNWAYNMYACNLFIQFAEEELISQFSVFLHFLIILNNLILCLKIVLTCHVSLTEVNLDYEYAY